MVVGESVLVHTQDGWLSAVVWGADGDRTIVCFLHGDRAHEVHSVLTSKVEPQTPR